MSHSDSPFTRPAKFLIVADSPIKKAMPCAAPETFAEKQKNKMFTAGNNPLPIKHPNSKGGVLCPSCGAHHQPGSICGNKSLTDPVTKSTIVGKKGGIPGHTGGNPNHDKSGQFSSPDKAMVVTPKKGASAIPVNEARISHNKPGFETWKENKASAKNKTSPEAHAPTEMDMTSPKHSKTGEATEKLKQSNKRQQPNSFFDPEQDSAKPKTPMSGQANSPKTGGVSTNSSASNSQDSSNVFHETKASQQAKQIGEQHKQKLIAQGVDPESAERQGRSAALAHAIRNISPANNPTLVGSPDSLQMPPGDETMLRFDEAQAKKLNAAKQDHVGTMVGAKKPKGVQTPQMARPAPVSNITGPTPTVSTSSATPSFDAIGDQSNSSVASGPSGANLDSPNLGQESTANKKQKELKAPKGLKKPEKFNPNKDNSVPHTSNVPTHLNRPDQLDTGAPQDSGAGSTPQVPQQDSSALYTPPGQQFNPADSILPADSGSGGSAGGAPTGTNPNPEAQTTMQGGGGVKQSKPIPFSQMYGAGSSIGSNVYTPGGIVQPTAGFAVQRAHHLLNPKLNQAAAPALAGNSGHMPAVKDSTKSQYKSLNHTNKLNEWLGKR
jgi:hypothetical protein